MKRKQAKSRENHYFATHFFNSWKNENLIKDNSKHKFTVFLDRNRQSKKFRKTVSMFMRSIYYGN